MNITRKTLVYRSRRPPQDALRMRLRELAASRVRFGYRRLTVILRREGWRVNPKDLSAVHRGRAHYPHQDTQEIGAAGTSADA
jgi:putative transposase